MAPTIRLLLPSPGFLRAVLCLLATLVLLQPAGADDSGVEASLGASLVRVFAPDEYGGSQQLRAAAQDSSGVLYFLDSSARLLMYDGARWSVESMPFIAWRLLIDTDDRIYIGGSTDIGYLTEEDGRRSFVSLKSRLREDQREFDHMWAILRIDQGIVYGTDRFVYLLTEDGSVEILATSEDGSIGGVFAWDDRLYIDSAKGLQVLEDGGFVEIPGAAPHWQIHVAGIVPYDATSALVFTRQHGTFRLGTQGLEPFPIAADPFLVEHVPAQAIRTIDGRYLLATLRGGAVILDSAGALIEVFDESLQIRVSNTVYSSMEDRQGNLWLMTDFGIVAIPRLPVRKVVDRTELEGTPHRTVRHQDRLYVATRTGLYRQVSNQGTVPDRPALESVPGIDSGTWFLMSEDDVLLAATYDGIFAIDDQGPEIRVEMLCPPLTVGLFRSEFFPERIFAGSSDGLRTVYRDGGKWTCGDVIVDPGALVYELVESADEMLLRTSESQLLRLTFPGGVDEPPVVREHQLPDGGSEFLRIDGEILLSNNDQGVLRYLGSDAEGLPFTLDESYAYLRPESEDQMLIHYEPEDGRLWLNTNSTLEVATRSTPGGRFERHRVAADSVTFWCDIYRDPELDLYWFTDADGVFSWKPGLSRSSPEAFPSLRRISSLGESGDLSSGGFAGFGDPPILPYAENALRFEFALPTFDQLGGSEYQYRLDGFDEEWSPWTTDSTKEYTNLREKVYRFRVRARDRWHQVSSEASFDFEIRSPFYRTIWAYAFYALAFVAAAFFALRLHQRRIAQERSVSLRLREVDQLKDEFLANTSHELRTPLYGITGLAESMIDGAAGKLPPVVESNLAMIVSSGRRLGHLVNDILDFSKLRHENLELAMRPVDLRSMTETVVMLSRPLVGAKDVEVTNAVPVDLPAAAADEDRLAQILHNLVGNAIKFTDAGSVTVSAEASDGWVTVRVNDTGIGIPDDRQQAIFELFEQGDASAERRFGGTGIGLAVTRSLVELHGGSIHVESTVGEGSTFSFTLPVAAGDVVVARPVPRDLAALAGSVATEVAATETDVEAPAAVASPNKARILVVDDEPVNRQVLKNYLAVESFELTLAASGEEALKLLDMQTFDLVLLDVMMPGMSGYEVCRTLRRHHPLEELPVIFLTATSQPQDVVAGLSLGANDFLTKPISRGELLARVRPHLDLHEINRRLEQLVEEKVSEIKVLQGLLPICATCKKIRDDGGSWNDLEVFIDKHSEASFSHGICPECVADYYQKMSEIDVVSR